MSLLLIGPVASAERGWPAKVRVGESVVVHRPGATSVAVHRAGRRRTVGHLATCPDCAGRLHAEGAWLCCAADGSVFAAATGEVRHGPATQRLRRVRVRVRRTPLIPG